MYKKRYRVLVFGYGKYGENIADQLRFNKYDVYIVENNNRNIRRARRDGFENIIKIDLEDDDEILKILLENDFKKVFCAFDDEEENIYLTITLRALIPELKIISICESRRKKRKLKLAGVDKIIDAIEIAANRLFFVLEKPAVSEAFDTIFFKDPTLIFKEVEIPRSSFLDGVNIDDVNFKKYNIIVIGLVDKELGDKFTFVTKGIRHKIDAGDILVVVGKIDDIENFKRDLNEVKR